MRFLKTWLLPIIVAASLGVYIFQKYRIPPQIHFEALTLKTLDGRVFTWKEVAEQVVLVNFFATWCGPCLHEMPELSAIQQTNGSNSVLVICITDEPAEKVTELAKRFQGQLLFLQLQQPMKEIGVHSWPTTYLLNKSGHIVFEQIGELDRSNKTLQQEIKKAL